MSAASPAPVVTHQAAPASSAAAAAAASASAASSPSALLFAAWMSRSESESFLQDKLDQIQALDKSVMQHHIVRDATEQQAHAAAAQQQQQHAGDATLSVHMEDISTGMPATAAPGGGRTTLINITPPTGPGVAISALQLNNSGVASPRSPLGGTRSPGTNGRVLLSPNPHPLDPTHLQVDEVSLRASPTSTGRRVSPIDAHSLGTGSPGSSPSPPTSPLASPNSLGKKRLGGSNKPLNLPSSPRLTSPSPPRSPARHISSPTPQLRSPQGIRPFYFPDGVPPSPHTKKREQDLIEQLFSKKDAESTAPGQTGMTVEELFPITTLVCGFSSYCNSALFEKLLQLQNELRAAEKGKSAAPEPALLDQPRIQLSTFLHFHAREIEKFDLPTRFFRLLRSAAPPTPAPSPATAGTTAAASAAPAAAAAAAAAPTPSASPAPASSSSSSSSPALRRYLTRDDFKPIVQEIVNRHPGLEFLESTPEFQLKYAQTVIARIFYQVNRAGNEQLTLRELRTSNFLLMLALLDQEDDINKLNDYFSYEHFYVVYCKFWELDEDHDGYIDAHDLIQYDDYALTSKVVERLMAGAGRKLLSPIPQRMNYLDFVVFLISEVDKNNDVALDYWFHVIDLDCDGLLTTFEIEYFFEEQKLRIQSLSQELITFPDIMCQMIDMVKKPLLLIDQANRPASIARSGGGNQGAGAAGYNYPHSSVSDHTYGGPPRLKAKEKHPSSSHHLSGMLPASAASHTPGLLQPSPTLQASTFHSHHKPYTSTATHTPVQGGAVYNVSEGVFYKRDLRDSHMAAQFFNCFPAADHQVLTEHGFMFLADVEAHFATHATLAIACCVRGALEWHDISAKDVTVGEREHTHILIRGGDKDSGAEWSIRPTDNHRMLARVSAEGSSTPALQIHTAGEIYAAGQEDESTMAQFIAAFSAGVVQQPLPVQPFGAELDLCGEEQIDAFLQLYGFWLGSGAVLDIESHSICLHLTQPEQQAYVSELLSHLSSVLPAALLRQEGSAVHITSASWYAFFVQQSAAAGFFACERGLLSRRQMRLLLAALHAAEGGVAAAGVESTGGVVHTSSLRFRDDLLRVCIAAGFASSFRSVDSQYAVSWSSAANVAEPCVRVRSSCKSVQEVGTVWCVTVPTEEQLIMFRHVTSMDEDGSVTAASAPLIVGNTLFNLNKFVQSEQRDPIRIKQIHDTPQLSDWDRYAISGYYRLAELPEAADAAQAWADMADGGEEDAAHDGHHMEVDQQGNRKEPAK